MDDSPMSYVSCDGTLCDCNAYTQVYSLSRCTYNRDYVTCVIYRKCIKENADRIYSAIANRNLYSTVACGVSAA